MPTAMPAAADAASYCPVKASDWTRGGYLVIYRGASAKGMSCSSVRYALGEFRGKIRRQGGHPRMARPFYDGYVTWYCRKTGGTPRPPLRVRQRHPFQLPRARALRRGLLSAGLPAHYRRAAGVGQVSSGVPRFGTVPLRRSFPGVRSCIDLAAICVREAKLRR